MIFFFISVWVFFILRVKIARINLLTTLSSGSLIPAADAAAAGGIRTRRLLRGGEAPPRFGDPGAGCGDTDGG